MRLILTHHAEATIETLERLTGEIRALQVICAGSVDAALAAASKGELNVVLASATDDLARLSAALQKQPLEERPIVLVGRYDMPESSEITVEATHSAGSNRESPQSDSDTSRPTKPHAASATDAIDGLSHLRDLSGNEPGLLRVSALMWTMGDAGNLDRLPCQSPAENAADVDDLQQWLYALAEMDCSAVVAIQGTRCLFVDETFASRMGFMPRLEAGGRLARAFAPRDRRAVLLWLQAHATAARQAVPQEGLTAHMLSDGKDIPVRLQRLPTTDSEFNALVISRVPSMMESGSLPGALLRTDEETGLPCLEAFCESVRHSLNLSVRGEQNCAVLVCRFDGLTEFARQLGQQVASQVVQHAVIRLRRAGGGVESMARVGPAEIAFVFVSLDARSVAEQHILRLQRSMQTPLIVENEIVPLVLRFGIAEASPNRALPTALIRKARTRAASSLLGSSQPTRPSPSAGSATRGSSLEHELEEAIQQQQFEVHLQPIIHLQTFAVRGAEVLLRWRHPQRGLLAPGHFLQVAESTRQIERIGQWVLDTVCLKASEWSNLFASPACFSVNVSPVELHNQNFLTNTLSTLGRHSTGNAQIELEITETAILASERKTADMVDCLRRRGVRVALDDFGVGYSSLAHLREISFSKLKIDRSFVHNLSGSHRCRTIIRSMIELGKGLHVAVNAEGVETPEQLRFLYECGADEVQGYLFAPPMASGRFASWLNGYQGEVAACDRERHALPLGPGHTSEADPQRAQTASNVLPFCRVRS